MRTTGNSWLWATRSQQRQLVDGCVELEVWGEELCGPRVDEAVRLSDGDVRDPGDVPDFCGGTRLKSEVGEQALVPPLPRRSSRSLTFLGLLLRRGLRGHVDGCCGHRDGAPAGHQVELHRLPGDVGGRHLHLLGQPQVGAEAGHEVSGGDEVHAGFQSLQDQLEAPANLFFGDPGDGADFCTGKKKN